MGIINKTAVDDVLTIFIAVLFFQSIPRFPIVGQYFEQYPLIVFIVALLLLVKRKEIIRVLGG